MEHLKKWIATDKEIVEGKTTDVYFVRTKECLDKGNLSNTQVWAEVTTGGIPREGKQFLFLGLYDVLDLFLKANLDVNVYSIKEGTILPNKDINGVRIPFLIVEGKYGEFSIYETPMLGYLCFQSGVGTAAAKLRIAAQDKTLLSFGIRRMPPEIAPTIDRACYIAGFDGISCVLSAEKLGISPTGTIPHALILIEGGIAQAIQSFDKHIDRSVSRVALADTFNDERVEVLQALEALGDKLSGVRLDTPSSRRGSLEDIVQEIKWELKLRGREDIKIFLSGGLTEDTVNEYRNFADGFGVGTFVSNSPTIDFALDIVDIEGESIAKRGKFAGRKQVGYCNQCQVYLCDEYYKSTIECPLCGNTMEKMIKQVMEKGRILEEIPTELEIREFVKIQLSIKSEL
jgi:nicotinate phosphoribosyltransferase